MRNLGLVLLVIGLGPARNHQPCRLAVPSVLPQKPLLLRLAIRATVRSLYLVVLVAFPLWSQVSPVDSVAAAKVNGEVIALQDLNSVVELEVAALRNRISAIRRAAINRLIDNKLIEQAARRLGLREAEYLEQEVEQVTVTDLEVDEAYHKSSSRFPGQLPSEVRYRIRRTLEDNRRADAFNALLKKLRADADVQNLLLEGPAVQLSLAENLRGPSIGRADAPVTVIGFIDFECPYCRAFLPATRKLRANDQVRLIFKHYPLQRHSKAYSAAKASVCAGRQGRFWEYHDLALSGEHRLTESGLAEIAKVTGLEVATFEECLTSQEPEQEIQRDLDLGRLIGVNGTPTIFINGRRLDSPSNLETAIADLLSSSANAQRHRPGR